MTSPYLDLPRRSLEEYAAELLQRRDYQSLVTLGTIKRELAERGQLADSPCRDDDRFPEREFGRPLPRVIR